MSELTLRKLEEMPKVKTKPSPKTNLRKLLDQFDSEKMKIAEIPVDSKKKITGIKIGLGKILKNDNRTDIEILTRIDEKAVILKRK